MNVKDAAPANADATKTATLTLGSNQQTMMPVRSGTIGPDVIDVARLYRDTGCFTYDPGFTSTANCSSRITYIDGDEGVLLYRGYPIEQLAEKSSFLEVCYLLLYGELPNKSQFDGFRNIVTRHTMVHEQMTRFFTGFRRDAHPMAVMCGSVGALSAFYHDFDRHQRSPAAHHRQPSPDRQDADVGGHGLQVLGRPALHLSAQRPRFHGELPADVLCRAVRALCGEPGRCPRARPHPDPARRPRAERLDLHRPARRLLRRQSLRLHRRRHRLPVGTRARRRQRSRSADAGGDRHRRPRAGVREEGQGQELGIPADGLRPPRLQELRPARQGHAADLPRGARTRWASRTSTS